MSDIETEKIQWPDTPKKIYLNICDDFEPEDDLFSVIDIEDVTWCKDRLNNNDIAYVRLEIAIYLVKALETLMQMDWKGQTLLDRLQFSDAGREIAKQCTDAVQVARKGGV